MILLQLTLETKEIILNYFHSDITRDATKVGVNPFSSPSSSREFSTQVFII